MSSKELKKLKCSFVRTIVILEQSVLLNTIVIYVTISEYSNHVMQLSSETQFKILWRILLLEQLVILLTAGLIKKVVINPLIKTLKSNQDQADTDFMTGLYNRNHFNKMIDVFNGFDRLSVFFIDINDLKYANDQFGHKVGDELITEVAKGIKKLNLKYSYRFGGDEFIIIVPNARMREVEEIKNQIFSEISQIKLDCELRPTIALGVACGQFGDINRLISEADKKMYRNKKKHKQHRI